jgi:folylpolyglutamate synthase
MEWVRPIESTIVKEEAEALAGEDGRVKDFGNDVVAAIRWGIGETKERGGVLVGTGSLYLAGEIHRLRRDDLI